MTKHFTTCAQWAQTSLNNFDLYPPSPPTFTFSKDETIHDKTKQKICPSLSGAIIQEEWSKNPVELLQSRTQQLARSFTVCHRLCQSLI